MPTQSGPPLNTGSGGGVLDRFVLCQQGKCVLRKVALIFVVFNWNVLKAIVHLHFEWFTWLPLLLFCAHRKRYGRMREMKTKIRSLSVYFLRYVWNMAESSGNIRQNAKWGKLFRDFFWFFLFRVVLSLVVAVRAQWRQTSGLPWVLLKQSNWADNFGLTTHSLTTLFNHEFITCQFVMMIKVQHFCHCHYPVEHSAVVASCLLWL